MEPLDASPQDDPLPARNPLNDHRFSQDVKVVEVRRSGHAPARVGPERGTPAGSTPAPGSEAEHGNDVPL